jgi:hypothetical protein
MAERIHWARYRVRTWAAETSVREFGEAAVRIRAYVSALGEAEEARSSTGGLLRRCVVAITRYDKGNRRCMLWRYRWSVQQRVQALANCRVGASVKEGIEADVEVLVVG